MAEITDIVLDVVRVEVAKLELKAGDVLAIKFLKPVPAEQAGRIREIFENVISDGVKVIAYPADEIELMVVKE